MRAAYYERVGPADDVFEVGEQPVPEPRSGEVRVRLTCSGVNPSDVKMRSGARGSELPFPRIVPHSDGSGVIDAVGDDVMDHTPGTRVWVWNAGWRRAHGTAAEYVVLPAEQAVPLPYSTSDEAGACLCIPALTACHAVLCHGGVKGQSVLVAGGAGAVGHYAIQIARARGAGQILTTVSSAEKARLAEAAGADAVIDRHEDIAARVAEFTGGAGVDRIIEVDLATNAETDLGALRRGGLIVAYGSSAPTVSIPFFPAILNNTLLQFFIVYELEASARRAAIDVLDELLAQERLQHNIAERIPLERIAEAHARVERGEVMGNVVLTIA